MSDKDIVDTIERALAAQLGSYPDRYMEWIDVPDFLAALRERYAIVEREVALEAAEIVHNEAWSDHIRELAAALLAAATEDGQ